MPCTFPAQVFNTLRITQKKWTVESGVPRSRKSIRCSKPLSSISSKPYLALQICCISSTYLMFWNPLSKLLQSCLACFTRDFAIQLTSLSKSVDHVFLNGRPNGLTGFYFFFSPPDYSIFSPTIFISFANISSHHLSLYQAPTSRKLNGTYPKQNLLVS